MATHYAMVPDLGHLAYEPQPSAFLGMAPNAGLTRRLYSEETARQIDAAVKQLVQQGSERAHRILTQHRDALELTAQRLLEQETLSEPELSAVLASVPELSLARDAA